MTFSNGAFSDDGTLIAPAAHSPDYETGVSGWSINVDGSAEFNDADIRGDLEVGTAPNARVRVEADADGGRVAFIPPDGSSTWTNGYARARADGNRPNVQLVSPKEDNASYQTASVSLQGGSITDSVSRIQYVAESHEFLGGLFVPEILFNGPVLGEEGFIDSSVRHADRNTSSATTTTSELVVLATSASGVFKDNVVYSVKIGGMVGSSAASGDVVWLRVRKGNTAGGDLWSDITRVHLPTSANYPFSTEFFVKNETGADITSGACLTVARNSGTGNVNTAASSNSVTYLNIRPVGRPSDYPNAKSIT